MSRRAHHLVAVAVIAVLGASVSCQELRQDVFECEMAVAHLKTCCPDFRAPASYCDYSENTVKTCTGTVTERVYPALTVEDSQCLKAHDCGAVVADGLCRRATTASRRSDVTPDRWVDVCPR